MQPRDLIRGERTRSVVGRAVVGLAWRSSVLLVAWLSSAVAVGQTLSVVGPPLGVPPDAGLEYLGARSWGALRLPATVATGCLPGAPGLRAPLAVPRQLGPLVQRMWDASPTFRRQCARLGEAGVTIVVGLDSRIDRGKMNAVTSIEVRSGLVQSATMHLRVSEPEYLAHEIEHVLEQVDGVDVRGSAQKGLDGVIESHAGAFETARAIAIGRVVSQEVARWNGGR